MNQYTLIIEEMKPINRCLNNTIEYWFMLSIVYNKTCFLGTTYVAFSHTQLHYWYLNLEGYFR